MSTPNIKKLCLGTAQFGMKYGIANKTGQIPEEDFGLLLGLAHKSGISVLDTASAYGASERLIGETLKESQTAFDFVSKLPVFKDGNIKEFVQSKLSQTCWDLNTTQLLGYLMHDFESFRRYPEMWKLLQEYKAQGVIRRLGFSLYHPQEWLRLEEQSAGVDILQIPYSLFDRRFEPYFAAWQERGIMVMVRSVFLQGLAFLPLNRLPPAFKSFEEPLSRLREISFRYGLTLSSLCLNFVLHQPAVDYAVIGIDGRDHLMENINAVQVIKGDEGWLKEVRDIRITDHDMLVPTNWSQT